MKKYTLAILADDHTKYLENARCFYTPDEVDEALKEMGVFKDKEKFIFDNIFVGCKAISELGFELKSVVEGRTRLGDQIFFYYFQREE